MRTNQKLFVLGVTLAGLVTGCGDRQSSAPAPSAQTTPGIEIDDTVVTTKVKSALLSDSDIKSFDLKVETRKGIVKLSGFVDSQTQIDRAIHAVQSVEGVKSVDNSISLKEGNATIGNTVDDDIITAKVKSALLSDPDIKSFDIAVVTRKNDVQLSGYVNNQAQIDQAIAIATKISGVTSVRNQMSVKK
jgi:hyperosmotically inducible protein